jgi:ABC-type multidrug transport system fused ATPase/permease subunit
VLATSPLLLGRTDVVAHVRAGRVVETGGHAELLDRSATYRALVSRDSEAEVLR